MDHRNMVTEATVTAVSIQHDMANSQLHGPNLIQHINNMNLLFV